MQCRCSLCLTFQLEQKFYNEENENLGETCNLSSFEQVCGFILRLHLEMLYFETLQSKFCYAHEQIVSSKIRKQT